MYVCIYTVYIDVLNNRRIHEKLHISAFESKNWPHILCKSLTIIVIIITVILVII